MGKFGKSIGYFKPSLYSVGERKRSGLKFIAYSERKDWSDFEINILTIGVRRRKPEYLQQLVSDYVEKNGCKPTYSEYRLMKEPKPVTLITFNICDERSDSIVYELKQRFEIHPCGNDSFHVLGDCDQIATHIEDIPI